MELFLLWTTWAYEYMDMFVNIDGHRTWGRFKCWKYVILTALCLYIN